MNNFDKSLELVLKHEGGFVNNPKDLGGPTNKGITLSSFRYAFGENLTENDLSNISDLKVQSFYFTVFWTPCNCELLPSGVDYMLFDSAINFGVIQAVKWLQRSIDVTANGKIGPETLSVVKKCSSVYLINYTLINRLNTLKTSKTWNTFRKEWERRISEVRVNSFKMIDN